MPFPIKVECQPCLGGEPTPHATRFGAASVAVKGVVDRRRARDHPYFKPLGEDGATCIVRHDLPSELREDAFYDRGQGAAW